MRRLAFKVIPAACGVLLAVFSGAASARTYSPTRTDDPEPGRCQPADCSLREAVLAANSHAGRDDIVLHSGETYTLTRAGGDNRGKVGDLDIRDDVTVHPSAAERATVDAAGIGATFDVVRGGRSRLAGLVLTGAATAAVLANRELAIVGSNLTQNPGGGVSAWRQLSLKRTEVSMNQFGVVAHGGATMRGTRVEGNTGGGGVFACHSLRLANTQVTGNAYTGDEYQAGGVQIGDFPDTGKPCPFKFEIKDSRIANNASSTFAGGIGAGDAQGEGTVRGSEIASNAASQDGAGGASFRGATTLVASSHIHDNGLTQNGYGSGGVSSYGRLRVVHTTIAGNSGFDGGGIDAEGDFLAVVSSTMFGNDAYQGGGVLVSGQRAKIVNSTIAHNKGAERGGGIAVFGSTVLLRSSTVAYNQAGPFYRRVHGGGLLHAVAHGLPFKIENSLIAENTLEGNGLGPQCSGSFASVGHNLRSSDDLGCDGFTSRGDIVRPNPLLGALADNGGPTQTIALMMGSPAIGAASRISSPKTDQRGVKRDRHPDIGAFERR